MRVPPSYVPGRPVPLLVALHGDEGISDYIFHAFGEHTDDAGYILFSPQCDAAAGCADSWWRWSQTSAHDEEWLDRQVDAVAAEYTIDERRIHLTGWSGGATYLGWWIPTHTARYASVAHLAGGSRFSDACPPCRMPAYFLLGSGDFMYDYASGLHARYETCAHETVWNEIPGAVHGDISALVAGREGAELIAWFDAHPHGCLAEPEPPRAAPRDAGPIPPLEWDGGAVAPEPAPEAADAGRPGIDAALATPAEPPRTGGDVLTGGCAATPSGHAASAWLLLVGLLTFRRSR